MPRTPRPILVVLAVLAAAACRQGGASPDDALVLSGSPPWVGQRTALDDRFESRWRLFVERTEIASFEEVRVERSVTEVLAVAGGAATRLRVRYDAHEVTFRDVTADDAATRPTPLHGRTYEIWAAEGGIDGVRAGGAPLTADERAELRELHPELGAPPVMVRMLAGKRLARGVRTPLDAADLAALTPARGGAADMRADAGAVTWRGLDGHDAVLALELTVSQDNRVGRSVTRMEGVVRYDLARQLARSVEMTGTFEGVTGEPIDGALMRGTITGTRTTRAR